MQIYDYTLIRTLPTKYFLNVTLTDDVFQLICERRCARCARWGKYIFLKSLRAYTIPYKHGDSVETVETDWIKRSKDTEFVFVDFFHYLFDFYIMIYTVKNILEIQDTTDKQVFLTKKEMNSYFNLMASKPSNKSFWARLWILFPSPL